MPRPYLLVNGLFGPWGGMDYPNMALAHHLARSGRETHLVGYRAHPDLLAEPHVHFHRVAKPADSFALGGALLDAAARLWTKRLAADGVRVVANGGNCVSSDATWVHYVHGAYPPDGGNRLDRRWTGRAAHAARRLKQRLDHALARAAELRRIPRARLVIADSNRTRDDLVRHLGVDDDRIRVVYYGTDAVTLRPASAAERAMARDRLDWPSDTSVVVFVGALGDRRKGFDTVFDAWRRLTASGGWTARLAVVGSGRDLPLWRSRAAAEGMADSMMFLGFRKDVPLILAASDALVSPTRYEAYGLGVHEALACGLPAFVSRRAGVAERFTPALDPLLLEDPDDAAELAEKLKRWVVRQDELRAHVVPMSDALRSYGWDDMAADIVRHIESER